MVAWGAKTGLPALTTEEHDGMKRGLAGYAYIEAFPGCHVVVLTPGDTRRELLDALRENLQGQRIQLLISPELPLGGQGYNGGLPREVWDEINRRTKP